MFAVMIFVDHGNGRQVHASSGTYSQLGLTVRMNDFLNIPDLTEIQVQKNG